MNRTLSHARRVTALLLAVLLLVPLAACAKQDEAPVPPYPTFEDPPIAERAFYPTSAYPDEGSLGDYYVKIKDARQMEIPYNDEASIPVLLIQYDFTNHSDTPISFDGAFIDYVFQNNAECIYFSGTAINGSSPELDQFDFTLASQPVQPGETVEICHLFSIFSDDPIEIYLTTGSLFEEEKLAKKFIFNPDKTEAELLHYTPNLGDYYVGEDIYYVVSTPPAEADTELVGILWVGPAFANFSPIPINFYDCMELHVYQDGKELEPVGKKELGSLNRENCGFVMDGGFTITETYFYLENLDSPVTVKIHPIGNPEQGFEKILHIGIEKYHLF